MSSAYLTRLPLAAGSVLAAQAGRAALWAIARYMRAPGTNTAALALMTVTAMAASNALYSQDGQHPAPFFAATSELPRPAEGPEPALRTAAPKLVTTTAVSRPVLETVAAPAPVLETPAKVGNADVARMQEKLKAMNLFSGTVDGYYGPKTASAIRAFEEQTGRKPVGAVTPEVISAILAAPLGHGAAPPAVQPPDRLETAAVPVPAPAAAAVPDALQLPTPAPLLAPIRSEERVAAPQPRAAALPVVARTEPAESEDLLNNLADRAANAFDAIAGMVGERQPMPRPLATPTSEIGFKPALDIAEIVTSGPAETNRDLVTKVQRGLASLGFLAGKIDGVAGGATAKAIRNFEVYYSYDVTGRVSPELLRLLVDAGATI